MEKVFFLNFTLIDKTQTMDSVSSKLFFPHFLGNYFFWHSIFFPNLFYLHFFFVQIKLVMMRKMLEIIYLFIFISIVIGIILNLEKNFFFYYYYFCNNILEKIVLKIRDSVNQIKIDKKKKKLH